MPWLSDIVKLLAEPKSVTLTSRKNWGPFKQSETTSKSTVGLIHVAQEMVKVIGVYPEETQLILPSSSTSNVMESPEDWKLRPARLPPLP